MDTLSCFEWIKKYKNMRKRSKRGRGKKISWIGVEVIFPMFCTTTVFFSFGKELNIRSFQTLILQNSF